MQTTSLSDGRWSSLISRLSEVADLEATARQFGAFQRARKVRSAVDLLRLAFFYGPGHLSLRHTAALADEAAIADLSDKGVLGRLRKAAPWLEHLLQCLLTQQRGQTLPAGDGRLDMALVDGSVICGPASKGTDWRLHARFDPGRGRFTDLVLSTGKVGERVDRTQITPGQTIIQDRGYARVRDFSTILAAKADFITRIGWQSLRLLDARQERVDPLGLLPEHDEPTEHVVYLQGIRQDLRLVIQRIPESKATQQRKRVARRANKSGSTLDPRSQIAAGYLMLLTSLPQTAQSAGHITALYRNRWQVELGFKRLKSIGGIDQLPATDPDLAKTWLLAHLITAVLTDELATSIVGFSPGAGNQAQAPNVALARLASRPSNHHSRDHAQTKTPHATKPH